MSEVSKKFFSDVMDAINGLDYKMLYMNGTSDNVQVKALTEDRKVVLYITTTKPIPEINGSFGVSNLGILNGIIGLKKYSTNESKLSINDKNGKPVEIVYKDDSKSISFRLADDEIKEVKSMKELNFNAPNYDVVIENPDKEIVKEFSSLSTILRGVDDNFYMKTEDKNLNFYIGDPTISNHNASITFAENVSGNLGEPYSYSSQRFKTVIDKNNGKCTLSISDQGAMSIKSSNELAEFKYILIGNTY